MIKAYISRPDAHLVVHRSPNCPDAKVGPAENVQHVLINDDSLSRELRRFRGDAYKLGDEEGRKDLWLILDFLDTEFEEALARHLMRLAALSCRELERGTVLVHC